VTQILVLHQKGYERDTFFPPNIRKQLEGIGELTWNKSELPFTEETILEVIGDKDVVLGGWRAPVFTSKVLDQAAKLKFIGQVGGSVRHYLTPEIFDRKITLTNAAEGTARYVAEAALTLILVSLKDVIGMNSHMKEDKSWPTGVLYTETLYGKKVGLIGLGRVGRAFVKLLKPFQVEIRVYDPYISESESEMLGIELTDLDQVLQHSDVISIHAARTEETTNMLNLEKLQMIKYGALLINTARAAIIDELALLGELKRGRFKAALDVFSKEPLPAESDFRKLPNVILTPHQIAATIQGRYELTQIVIDDLKLFLQGRTPKYNITKEIYHIMA
jgi:phosphoglycerate dehydrogenase-like enzyme